MWGRAMRELTEFNLIGGTGRIGYRRAIKVSCGTITVYTWPVSLVGDWMACSWPYTLDWTPATTDYQLHLADAVLAKLVLDERGE